MQPVIIILAGGAGKRMRSATPKVLHHIRGKPMIVHVLETAAKLDPARILVVVPPGDVIPPTIAEGIHPQPEFVIQTVPRGTADAVRCCLPLLAADPTQDCLILSGDVPLIRPSVLHRLMQVKCSLLVANVPQPRGYGRIVFGPGDDVIACIVEEKDCTPAEAAIATVNCGIYNIPAADLAAGLPHIGCENSSREFYLTDLVAGLGVRAVWLEEAEIGQIRNVNTPEDLAAAGGAPLSPKTEINNPASLLLFPSPQKC